jgi:hypothetical protein
MRAKTAAPNCQIIQSKSGQSQRGKKRMLRCHAPTSFPTGSKLRCIRSAPTETQSIRKRWVYPTSAARKRNFRAKPWECREHQHKKIHPVRVSQELSFKTFDASGCGLDSNLGLQA